MDDAKAITIIANTFTNNDNSAYCNSINYNPSFNAIDKVVELYEGKIALYERMLKDKKAMIEELKKIVSR